MIESSPSHHESHNLSPIFEIGIGKNLEEPASVWSIEYSTDGTTLLMACSELFSDPDNGGFWILNATTEQQVFHVPMPWQECVYGASFSPDATKIAGAYGSHVSVWTAEVSGEQPHTQVQLWEKTTTTTPQITLVLKADLDPADAALAAAAAAERFQFAIPLPEPPFVWDTQKVGPGAGKLWAIYPTVTSVMWSPSGTELLTASSDGVARIWHAQDGHLVKIFRGHRASVRSARFAPDGCRIVTASLDHTARIWDTHTGACLLVLQAHTAGLNGAVWSADGRYVTTTSNDHTACIWDAETGQLLHTLRGHTYWVTCAAFSPDGTYLISGAITHSAFGD